MTKKREGKVEQMDRCRVRLWLDDFNKIKKDNTMSHLHFENSISDFIPNRKQACKSSKSKTTLETGKIICREIQFLC